MAVSYTQAQKDSINSYIVLAYYNSISLGIFDIGDHTFSYTENYNYSTSSGTGNTDFKAHLAGTETMYTFNMREYNKNTIKECLLSVQAVSSGTATAAGTPFVGAIEGVANPRSAIENSLVVYPVYTDSSGTQYADDTTNPLAYLLPKAVCVEGMELVFNAENNSPFELKFKGMPDVANGNRTWIEDDGIDTDGTYTP